MTEKDKDSFIIACLNCGCEYDCLKAEWCECITSRPSLVCPHCGKCFCEVGTEEMNAFWSKAPRELWRRRLDKRYNDSRQPPGEEGNPAKRPLILVAEDNDQARLTAFRVLEELGYGVLLAKDGLDAFVLAKRYRPDLVLTDQLMPHMLGSRLSLMIKEDSELSDTRVLIMTALYKKDSERISLLRQSKADDYLVKPINFDKLGEIIAGWLD